MQSSPCETWLRVLHGQLNSLCFIRVVSYHIIAGGGFQGERSLSMAESGDRTEKYPLLSGGYMVSGRTGPHTTEQWVELFGDSVTLEPFVIALNGPGPDEPGRKGT